MAVTDAAIKISCDPGPMPRDKLYGEPFVSKFAFVNHLVTSPDFPFSQRLAKSLDTYS